MLICSNTVNIENSCAAWYFLVPLIFYFQDSLRNKNVKKNSSYSKQKSFIIIYTTVQRFRVNSFFTCFLQKPLKSNLSKDSILYLGQKPILSRICSVLLLACPSQGSKVRICSPCRLTRALHPVWVESVIWALHTAWPPLCVYVCVCVFAQTKQGQEVTVFVWVSSAGLTSFKPASHMIQFIVTRLRPEKSMIWHFITFTGLTCDSSHHDTTMNHQKGHFSSARLFILLEH